MIISLIAALVSMSTARRIVRPLGALHDAGLLLELPAHLLDDRAGGAADGRHGDAAEQVGDQAAEDQAGHDVGVGEVERDRPTPLK